MRPALLAGACLAACAYVDPDPGWATRDAQVAEATAFTEAGELRGVDALTTADAVTKGDRILYGIAFEKGGETRHWLVHVEVEDPGFEPRKKRDGSTSLRMLLNVRVCDEEGEELGREVVTVSREDLVFGLFSACLSKGEDEDDAPSTLGEHLPTPAEADDPGPQAPAEAPFFGSIPIKVSATLALLNMLRVVRDSDVLFDILWTVIDRPSIFSIIRNFGVTVSLKLDFENAHEVEPVTLGGQALPAFELPVEMRLNGTPALRSKVVVTESRSPLNLSAGIVAVDAFQPSDPGAHVSIRVLAARRATGQPR